MPVTYVGLRATNSWMSLCILTLTLLNPTPCPSRSLYDHSSLSSGFSQLQLVSSRFIKYGVGFMIFGYGISILLLTVELYHHL